MPVMKFIATRHAPDGDYTEKFEAKSWSVAAEYCQKKMWRLDGELQSLVRIVPKEIASSVTKQFKDWLRRNTQRRN